MEEHNTLNGLKREGIEDLQLSMILLQSRRYSPEANLLEVMNCFILSTKTSPVGGRVYNCYEQSQI